MHYTTDQLSSRTVAITVFFVIIWSQKKRKEKDHNSYGSAATEELCHIRILGGSSFFLNIFFTLRFYTWINVFQVYLISDGCYRNVPTNLPKSKQKSNNGYKVVPENNRLPCTTNETLAKSCLNGGTCLASDIASNVKQISCQ